ncbi:MAG: ketosteroid isomerase-related protein [Rudaea sp.]
MIIDGSRAADRTAALILRYYAALNRGDVDGAMDCVADGVVHDINQGSRETGKTAFRDYLQRTQRSYREEIRDIVVMSVDDGTRAAAEFAVHGVYQANDDGLPPAHGQRYVLFGGAFFAINQGTIARITNYNNRRDLSQQVERAS